MKKTWKDFIIENFVPGRVNEISEHINKMNQEKKFKPERKDVAPTVQYWLPLLTEGRIRENSKRSIKEVVFEYDQETKRYYKPNTESKKELLLTDDRSNQSSNIESGKVSYERDKDLSKTHQAMLDVIEEYAITNDLNYDIDKVEYVDFIHKNKDNTYSIYEIKSYSDSIYTAIGQLEYYAWRLEHNYKNVKVREKVIVGNFKLQEKFKKFIKDNDIKYKNIDEFK